MGSAFALRYSACYDSPGNLVSVTDQASNQIQYSYDAANQLVNVVQVNSPNTNANTTIFGYDADGNPITFEDANTHTTMQSFDLLSELTQKTLPDGTLSESRTYDNNGNLSSVTHFNGAVTTYTYDALNRLLSRTTPGEATVSHTYTSTGQYATTTDASGSTTYRYDSMDRITAKATPEGTLNYTYDAAGHVASIASSNTNGASMSYTYDSLNRLSTVVDNRLSGSNTTTYTYDNASNVGTVTYPNGVQSTFTYDTLNRVSGLSSQVSGYTYQRGPTGNLTSAAESNGRAESWSYDGIYRLTNETISLDPNHANGAVSYGLDPVGNRLSESSSLTDVPSGSFGYNPDDELVSESYDQNGNVTATGGKTFTYDSQNELVSMSASVSAVGIVYDGFGNRVSKTVNGVTTKYLVEDDKNPTGYPQVFDELTNGAVTRTDTYGLQRISENQVISSTWTSSFYGYDGGGNVRQLTNSADTITDTYEYDAFGNKVNSTGTTPNNYLYRGEQYDSDLGLYYLRARYYNPTSGRFTGVDPLTDQGEKRYEYAAANPVDGADPTGTEDLAEYRPLFPGALPFISVHFPNFECGQLGSILGPIADLLPFCSEPPEPPSQPPCHKCFARLLSRPVAVVGRHTYWWLKDRNDTDWIIDGGPEKGALEGWISRGDKGIPPAYPKDNPDNPRCFDSGTHCSTCDQVDAMKNSVPRFNRLGPFPYDFGESLTGPGLNSNSFAHWVGEQGGFDPSPPEGAVDWYTPVPNY